MQMTKPQTLAAAMLAIVCSMVAMSTPANAQNHSTVNGVTLCQYSSANAEYQTGMSLLRAGGQWNASEAATHMLAAAKKGHAAAQYQLGRMYEQGIGVSQEYRKAAALYKRAANQGHLEARAKFNEPMWCELIRRPDTAEVDPLRYWSSSATRRQLVV